MQGGEPDGLTSQRTPWATHQPNERALPRIMPALKPNSVRCRAFGLLRQLSRNYLRVAVSGFLTAREVEDLHPKPGGALTHDLVP